MFMTLPTARRRLPIGTSLLARDRLLLRLVLAVWHPLRKYLYPPRGTTHAGKARNGHGSSTAPSARILHRLCHPRTLTRSFPAEAQQYTSPLLWSQPPLLSRALNGFPTARHLWIV